MYLFLPDLKKIYSTLMALMATGEILLRPACVANLEKYLGYVFSIHCTFLSLKFVAL
jgi:hypothetical protein